MIVSDGLINPLLRDLIEGFHCKSELDSSNLDNDTEECFGASMPGSNVIQWDLQNFRYIINVQAWRIEASPLKPYKFDLACSLVDEWCLCNRPRFLRGQTWELLRTSLYITHEFTYILVIDKSYVLFVMKDKRKFTIFMEIWG